MPKLIRMAKSLSPLTLQTIPAKVIETDEGIFLEKTDEKGTTYCSLIERDKELYYRAVQKKFSMHNKYYNMIYTTSKCNLSCSFCYEMDGDKSREMSLEKIKDAVRNSKNKIFLLIGREPTLDNRLEEIIRIISKNNYASLVTNGLKLADNGYLQSLCRAGLQHITFSLHSVDNNEADIQLNNAAVQKKKLKALENIERANIPTIISMTIARNVNEGEIKKAFEICARKPSQFYELRVRSAVPTGYHLDKDNYCLSELLKLTCSELGFEYANLKKEFDLLDAANQYLKNRVIEKKTCTSFYHVRINKDGSHESLSDILLKYEGKFFPQVFLWLGIISPVVINRIKDYLRKNRPYAIPGFVRISIQSWPTLYNIDLEEIVSKCVSSYVDDDKSKCFCLTNISEAFNKTYLNIKETEGPNTFPLEKSEFIKF